jgi:hypothetical protein
MIDNLKRIAQNRNAPPDFVVQPINKDDQYNVIVKKVHPMIDNYVYLYHTDTLIAIPTYPETIADSMQANFNQATPLSRSAPIFSYSNSGPRGFNVSLALHRDLMNGINVSSSNLNLEDISKEDYVDILVKQIQAIALPRYAAAQKMVNPPMIAVRFGNDIFCKGVVTGGVTVTYAGPILRTDKYAQVNIDFQISEVDPYDADSVMSLGSYRGINQDLERRIWKSSTSEKSKGAIK